MNSCRIKRRDFLVTCLALVALAAPAWGAREDVAWSGIKGAAGRHLGAWLSAVGAGIESPSAGEGALAEVVRVVAGQSWSQAETNTRSSIAAMVEAAHARAGARAPTREFRVETLWICGGCIDIDLLAWDWADLNAAFWIEPWAFLGEDPSGAVSQAFLACRELTIEQLDDEGVAMERWRTEDRAMIGRTYRALLFGLQEAGECQTPSDWANVAPVDLAAYAGVRPSLRVVMTGEVSLLAEIDAQKGLIVLHTDGKRGVYGIDVVTLLDEWVGEDPTQHVY